MRNRSWLFLMAAGMMVLSTTGCNEHPKLQSNQAAGSVEQQFDTRHVDGDGDGDRAKLSGYNNINNPPVDLRTVPPAHAAGTKLTHGMYSGNGYADTIARLTLSIPGVTHAAAVTSGQVVLVGIGVSQKGNPNIQHINQEIRRRLLTQAPEFRFVYVTAHPQQVTAINQIADGLRSGQPLSTFTQRIANLTRTMNPVPYTTSR